MEHKDVYHLKDHKQHLLWDSGCPACSAECTQAQADRFDAHMLLREPETDTRTHILAFVATETERMRESIAAMIDGEAVHHQELLNKWPQLSYSIDEGMKACRQIAKMVRGIDVYRKYQNAVDNVRKAEEGVVG